jgi:hypothetical protein
LSWAPAAWRSCSGCEARRGGVLVYEGAAFEVRALAKWCGLRPPTGLLAVQPLG